MSTAAKNKEFIGNLAFIWWFVQVPSKGAYLIRGEENKTVIAFLHL